MSVAAPFTEALIAANAEALQQAQGMRPPLAALVPGVARAVADPTRGLAVELRARDERWIALDGVAPEAEAAARMAPHRGAAQLVLVGLGLGYALDALDAAGSRAGVLAIEPDPGVATLFLARRDWRPWIVSNRLRLLVGPDYAGAASVARWVNGATPPAVLVSETLLHLRPKSTEKAAAIARRVLGDAESNADARRRFAGRYLLQTLGNLATIARESDAAALDGLAPGVPAVVVGAGPSLDVNAPELAALQDRAVVIAADTAVRPLLAAGVRPHLAVGVDPGEMNARHLEGLTAVDDVWLVGEGSLHPAAFPPFRGRTFTFRVSEHEPWPWLRERGVERGLLRAWGSVVTSALDLALRMGCNPIVFAGVDLAYTGERSYCANTIYDTIWRDVLMQAYNWSFEQLMEDYFAQRTTVWEPDLRGERVRTASHLLAFRNWLLDQAAAVRDRRFVNATGAGMLYGPAIEQAGLRALLAPAPRAPDLRARIAAAWQRGHTLWPAVAADLRRAGLPADAAGPVVQRWVDFTLDTVSPADVRRAIDAAATALDEEEVPAGMSAGAGLA